MPDSICTIIRFPVMSVFHIYGCTIAIPVTAKVGKIKFDLLESDALKLKEAKNNHLMI